jgi:hypothetical protein
MIASAERDLMTLFREGYHDLAVFELNGLYALGRAIIRFLEWCSGPSAPPMI